MLATWLVYATLLTSLIYLGALAAETIVGIWGGRRRLVWVFSLFAAMSAPMVLATRHTAPEAASGAAPFVVGSSARLAPALPRMETALSTVSDDRGPVRRGQVSPIAQVAATVEPFGTDFCRRTTVVVPPPWKVPAGFGEPPGGITQAS